MWTLPPKKIFFNQVYCIEHFIIHETLEHCTGMSEHQFTNQEGRHTGAGLTNNPQKQVTPHVVNSHWWTIKRTSHSLQSVLPSVWHMHVTIGQFALLFLSTQVYYRGLHMQTTEFGPKNSKGRTLSGTKCADLTLKKVDWKHCKGDPNTRTKLSQLLSHVELYAIYVDFSSYSKDNSPIKTGNFCQIIVCLKKIWNPIVVQKIMQTILI